MRVIALATLLFALATPSMGDDYKIVRGLSFDKQNPSLTLDLYLPSSQTEAVPCVITIQGGGFAPQNGKRFKPFAERLAKAGIAAALISYRGRPEHQHETTTADVRAAVKFIRRNGNQYNVNTSQIGAMGRSAGGTLAALLALQDCNDEGWRPIQAAVCFAGVFDFVSRFTDEEQLALQPNHATKIATNGEWIGAPFSRENKEWKAASAVNHIDEDDPPILFLHSRDDTTVPWIQSQKMFEAMKAKGVPSELIVYESGGHGVRPTDADSMQDMIDFFEKTLK